jgi:hypothetical protein
MDADEMGQTVTGDASQPSSAEARLREIGIKLPALARLSSWK